MHKVEDLELMTVKQLADNYNAISGKPPVKKFASKAEAIKRLLALNPEQKIAKAPAKGKKKATVEKAPVKAKAKVAAKVKVKKTQPAKTVSRGRIDEIVLLLRAKPYTIPHLMAKFDTVYKNITGDLYMIRKKRDRYLDPKESLICDQKPDGDRTYTIK